MLDDTTVENGAIYNFPGSHKEGLLKKDVTRVAISLVAVPWVRHKYGRTWEGVNYFATFLVVR